jgi:hypothetical protein
VRRMLLGVIAVLLCAACTGQSHAQPVRRLPPILRDPASPIRIEYPSALISDPLPTPRPSVTVSADQALVAIRSGAAPQGKPRMALRLVKLTNPIVSVTPRLMWVFVWPESARVFGGVRTSSAQDEQARAAAARARCVGVDAVDATTARVHGYWVMCA